MGACTQIILVLLSCISMGAQNASGISIVWQRRGEAAGGGCKGGAAHEDVGDSKARMNDETMSLPRSMLILKRKKAATREVVDVQRERAREVQETLTTDDFSMSDKVGAIWIPAGGRLEFRLQRKAGYRLEKSWDQFFKNVDVSWAVQLEAACRHFGSV
ncbi:hypothetical protein C8J57DRAFT_1230776 [Mycena rebaudengoi]|nr:hypothetical protein C8J57DRAFT_1230776 [Mycena rebaudengoi]